MGTMKYTYISGVNANMSDYANANAINDYANGTNANTNGNASDVATKSSARKFVTLSAVWQTYRPEFLGRRDQDRSIGKYIHTISYLSSTY